MSRFTVYLFLWWKYRKLLPSFPLRIETWTQMILTDVSFHGTQARSRTSSCMFDGPHVSWPVDSLTWLEKVTVQFEPPGWDLNEFCLLTSIFLMGLFSLVWVTEPAQTWELSLDGSRSRSCHNPPHLARSYEECWFFSLFQFIAPVFKQIMENNFILVIKSIDSCTEGGCFLLCRFVKHVLCVFLHTWHLHLVWSVNVLYSIWRCWTSCRLHLMTNELQWSFRHFVKCWSQ